MNALPLKNQMKNVFRGNQIFTKFYLSIAEIKVRPAIHSMKGAAANEGNV